MLRTAATAIAALGLLLTAGPAQAARTPDRVGFPSSFPLPDGFRPEGIAIGPGPKAYFGSLATGSIYQADLRTGQGRIISEGPGTPSVGLKSDRRGRLFVSGGNAGNARVVDIGSGAVLASYQLASGPAFVNDVLLTHGAAWFTDSLNPVLYKLTLGRRGDVPAEAERIPLTGDLVYIPGFNVNGIAPTPDHRALLLIQSNTGGLFRADPATGVTTAVDLGGETLTFGDGLLVIGRTLYVVRNQLNTVVVVRLNPGGTAGRVVDELTDPRFDVPTTVAAFGGRLYLPNARFSTQPTPDTPYSVIAIRR